MSFCAVSEGPGGLRHGDALYRTDIFLREIGPVEHEYARYLPGPRPRTAAYRSRG